MATERKRLRTKLNQFGYIMAPGNHDDNMRDALLAHEMLAVIEQLAVALRACDARPGVIYREKHAALALAAPYLLED